MMKCAMIISKSRKTQNSNDGDSGNRNDQYFEGQSVRASMDELKGLRSEVIRLRHALNANSRSSSGSSSSKSEKHFNRETADAQVIRDLKAEVSTLRTAVHKANVSNQNSRSPGSGGSGVTTVDSNTYSIMQQQLRDLHNRERKQVSVTHKQDCIHSFLSFSLCQLVWHFCECHNFHVYSNLFFNVLIFFLTCVFLCILVYSFFQRTTN